MAEPVYKVLRAEEFAEAASVGHFVGSPADLRDGFIHLSAAHQLAGTLAKHFAREDGLVLLAFDPARLGAHLRWEPSRDGAQFPHLYAPLDFAALLWAEPLTLETNGHHALPSRLRGRAREGG
jgi:uncharacterized protein (DUF952 family)